VTGTGPFPYAGEVAALASSALWAGAGIVFRRMRGRVAPAGVNFAKNATAALCFTVVLLALHGRPWPVSMPLEAQAWLVLSGLVGLSVCDTFFLRAMMEIGPRRATLLMALAPVLVFAAAVAPPFCEGEALGRPLTWVGLTLALLGIGLATREVPGDGYDPANARRGVRDGLWAAGLQAAGVLMARHALDLGAGPVDGAAVRMVAGSLGILVGGTVLGHVGGWFTSLRAPGTLRTLATAAFFGTFLGIGLNQCGLAWSASTGVATTLNSLAPVWLIPLSTIFLAEHHGARAWLSTVLALAGVALLSA
jgi:drug/metabolite transporter (DMT)-like permease